jgi:hypothetical protein
MGFIDFVPPDHEFRFVGVRFIRPTVIREPLHAPKP